ncbi:protein of unknown function [Shewanella benthica]|uniref:Uncharacterized protein n=1 Tax=Shewanella benthica TaxID=43661 RepID=A0A330MCA0_9GAMM|nr:protein of unknown function [Shewanella benthica]
MVIPFIYFLLSAINQRTLTQTQNNYKQNDNIWAGYYSLSAEYTKSTTVVPT